MHPPSRALRPTVAFARPHSDALFVYVDEAGNFDFSAGGTRYFVVSCLVVSPPFSCHHALLDAKYEFLRQGFNLEYFHASENKQIVRDAVFSALAPHLESLGVYSIILQKNKAHPRLHDPRRFYPLAVGWLMKHALPRSLNDATRSLVVVTDSIPLSKRRREAEKSLKASIAASVPDSTSYHIFHHQSRSDLNLQIVDYVNWAIFRKWEREDARAYQYIRAAIRSEGDLFRAGTVEYY